MINILYLTSEDVTLKEHGSFWDQGVTMDDWDFMVLIDPKLLTLTDRGTWTCEQFAYSFFRADADENMAWYPAVMFRGKCYGVGVYYH